MTSMVTYVAHGLAAGEAVLVAASPDHHELVDAALVDVGVDLVAATESGQYVRLDADALHDDLPRLHHIDRERFDTLIGGTVEQVSRRWRSFRVFGEIVDLYWRRGDDHLALELEACWNALREGCRSRCCAATSSPPARAPRRSTTSTTLSSPPDISSRAV